jgi:ubiquinone/menaquinone biosynthesis C-methylase UbiE
MSKPHEALVNDQFGPRAKAYVASAVHARGADLDALKQIVRAAAPAHALDLGAGGGHVSYLLSPYAGNVTATDLSSDMLAAVRITARERGIANIATVPAPAERLPFPEAAFDFLACRYTAHHWRDFEAGLREGRRVLASGAPAVFIDAFAPAAAMLDTHLQAVELLRDASHARNYTTAQWFSALARAGFMVRQCRTWRLRMDFSDWTSRMRTPDTNQRAIRAVQEAASAEVRRHFAIESDGSFMLDILMVEATAA